jgi:malate dehydrogenase (oxaloacetate-decarboxylating)(NADP+)
MFLGLSVGNCVTPEMLKEMAPNPIVFAMANPNPEIPYEDALACRKDLIFATGRSDYPNQINNVLGFPFIFRGALDVRATTINEEMKLAAVHALAKLTKEDVPETVNMAYKTRNLKFGPEYIIPKPLDPRLITTVAPAVAKAAIDSGVARHIITDWDAYRVELMKRMGLHNKLVNDIRVKAKTEPKRVVYAEAENYRILKAAQMVEAEGIAHPILLGNEEEIRRVAQANNLDLPAVPIIDWNSPKEETRRRRYADLFFQKRQRKGITYGEAYQKMFDRNYFGVMMVETGDADAMLSGFVHKYPETIRPALQIVGTNNTRRHIAGMYIVMNKRGPLFFADTTVNIKPEGQTLVDTTLLVAREVSKFNIEPVIALLSFSNFGSITEGSPSRVREAVRILHKEHPELIVDGEMQANVAFNKELREKHFPFSKINGRDVNTIIFPNLSSGNIAYKLMTEVGGAEVIGPILVGIRKPIHVLQQDSSIREIVNMTAISVIDAQSTTEGIIEL